MPAPPAIGGFRLSPQQRRLWSYAQAGRPLVSWLVVRLGGALDAEALRRALDDVVRNHEVLAAAFRRPPGLRLPVQVPGCGSARWSRLDLSPLPADRRRHALAMLMERQKRAAFDLERGRLVHAVLARCGGEEHRLVVALPSLAVDARGLENLFAALSTAYGARTDGGAYTAPALDWVRVSEWQRQILEMPEAAAARGDWTERLAAVEAAPPLPMTRRRRGDGAVPPAIVEHLLPAHLPPRLRALTAGRGDDDRLLVLAAWGALLARLGGGTVCALGYAVDGRDLEPLRAVIGPLARWLPVACRQADEPALAAVDRWRREVEQACERGDVFDAGEPEDGAPLFRHAFELQPRERETAAAGGVVFELETGVAVVEPCDLALSLATHGERSLLRLRYDPAVVAAGEVRRLVRWLAASLEVVAERPELPWARHVLERPARRGSSSATTAAAAGAAALPVHRQFLAAARRHPHRPAVVAADGVSTYGELESSSRQLAERLRGRGVGPERVVAVADERSAATIRALLAVLRAGGAYLPLDVRQPLPRLRRIVAAARPLLLVAGDGGGELGELGLPIVSPEPGAPRPSRGAEADGGRSCEENLAYVVFTSGSTGEPKGVAVEHRHLAAYVQAVRDRLGLPAEAAYATASTLAADLGLTAVFPALTSGGCLHLIDREVAADPERLAAYLADHPVDLLKIVPSHLRALRTSGDPRRAGPARWLVLGGEACTWDLVDEVLEGGWSCELLNHYGPTETTVGVLTQRVRREDRRETDTVPLGRPLGDARAWVLDGWGEPVLPWQSGEIHVAGPTVSRGYLGRPRATAERFLPDPLATAPGQRMYRTGDRARLLGDGRVEYLGRVDDQLKLRGNRIEPGEVAAVLAGHPGVREAVVVHDTGPAGARLVAYAVPRRPGAGDGQRVLRLPNGLTVVQQNRNETEYLYGEIFERETYLQHGVELPAAAVVLDLGANIGLFSLFAAQHSPGARIYAFEPVPPIFRDLRANAERSGADIRAFPLGVADRPGVATFTYYSRHSMMSGLSRYARPEEERQVIARYLRNAPDTADGGGELVQHLDELLEGRFEGEAYQVRLTTVSEILRAQRIERVDLLKIDVQRAELDVLAGIEDADWPRIEQVVMEVHEAPGRETQGRTAAIVELLAAHGLRAVVDQDPLLRGTDRWSLYAVRPGRRRPAAARRPPPPAEEVPAADPAGLRRYLADRLPDYMVPSAVVLLDAMPLTANGKLDRAALPRPEAVTSRRRTPPRAPVELILAGLWQDLLGVPEVDLEDDFFALGGHSLVATRLIARVRDLLDIKLPLRTLFEAPTLGALAAAVEAARRQDEEVPSPPLRRLPWRGDPPLSFAQERLWFLDRLGAGDAGYAIPTLLRFEGRLDLAALAASLRRIVERHEILRTSLPQVDGRPVQRISASAQVPLPVLSLGGLSAGRRRPAAQAVVQRAVRRRFDLARGPLLRVLLLDLGDDEALFLIHRHHAVSDGWSNDVFVAELAACYAALRAGGEPALPPLPVQYADFARWQRERLQGAAVERHLRYWRHGLAGLQALELPTDRPRGRQPHRPGAYVPVQLEPALVERLAAFSRRSAATLFMTLLAAFLVLLRRWSQQDDLAVGTPVSGRDRTELEPLIGPFINTLVVRVDAADEPPFRRFVERVRKTVLDGHDHRDLPFEALVEDLRPERDASRSPLFQVAFVLQPASPVALDLPGLAVELEEIHGGAAKFDWTLSLFEDGGRLRGSLEYDRRLFDATTAARAVGHLESLLRSAVARPEARIGDLPLLGPAERHQLLLEWGVGDRLAPEEGGVVERVARRAASAPDRVAVSSDREGELTYGTLEERSTALAHRLRELGVTRETVVGILLDRSPDAVVAWLAVWKAGGCCLPLDPALPSRRLLRMMETSGAGLVVSRRRSLQRLDGWTGTVCGPRDEAEGTGELPGPAAPAALAYVLYTSGSTGQPKASAIPHSALASFESWYRRSFDLGFGSRVGHLSGLGFDAVAMEIWPTLCAGATVVMPGDEHLRLDGGELAAWFSARGVTHCFLPTPLGEDVLAREEPPPRSLRILTVGGERMRTWLRGGPRLRVLNVYGPTETTILATTEWLPATAVQRPPRPPIGRPLAAVRAQVLDRALRPVPIGAVGELFLSGAGVARGYWRRPGWTAERFLPDPGPAAAPGDRCYRTGDLVRWLPDGRLDFLGRADHQVQMRGLRVELGEIEGVLAAHPQVHQAQVLRYGDEGGAAQLTAYVVGARTAEAPPAAELRAYLRRELPEPMVPAAFVFLEAFPRTPSGKIDRRALPPPAPEHAATGTRPAQTDLERAVAGLWGEVLEVPDPGLDDDFFALGGHSLLAVRLAGRIRDVFGVELPLQELFEHPSPSRLVEILQVALGPPGRAEEIAGAWLEIRDLPEEEVERRLADPPVGGAQHAEGEGEGGT